MMRHYLIIIPSLGLILLAALMATAAPIIPSKTMLPYAVRSLAELDQLQVRIMPFTDLPPQLQLSAERVESIWRRKLVAAGFDVVDDENTPRLELKVKVLSDPDVPDALAMLAVISLKQKVNITRLNKQMPLATYTRAYTSIEPTDRTVKTVGHMLEAMIDGFIAKVRLANRYHKQPVKVPAQTSER